MNVAVAGMPLEKTGLKLRQIIRNDLAESKADVTPQALLEALGDPHQMVLDVKSGVGGSSVALHSGNLPEVIT